MAVDQRLTALNFTLSGQLQHVENDLIQLEGRVTNLESEVISIEELIEELGGRLERLELTGWLKISQFI